MGSVITMTIMNSELFNAVMTGLTDRVIDLAGTQGMKDHETSEGHTILHLAAMFNKHITAGAILQKFPELLPKMNKRTETALHLAARKGYFLVIRQLIATARASNLIQDFIRKPIEKDGNTALHLAAQKNHLRVVEEIVNADPTDKHSLNKNSETPLYLAALGGHNSVVKKILEICTYAASDGPEDKTALHAAVISRDADCVNALLLSREGSDLVEKADKKGWTAMHYAASKNCVSLLKTINDKLTPFSSSQSGPKIPSEFEDNPIMKSPLHIAASEGHISSVQKLIELYGSNYKAKVADVDEEKLIELYEDKQNILHKIAAAAVAEDELLQKIAAVDEDKQNILHIAAAKQHIELIENILKDCPKILLKDLLNKGDKDGNTPLHLLVKGGCFVRELIEHEKVDPDVKNNDNLTPWELLYWDENIEGDQLKIKETMHKVQHGLPLRRMSWKFWDRIGRSNNNRTDDSLVSSTKYHRKNAKFLKKKKNEMQEEVKVYRDRASTQIIVTALITTVTFTVGFTMPGGYHQNEGKENYGSGSAFLSRKPYFKVSMVADGVALFFSTCSLFLYFILSLYEDPEPVKKLSTLSVVLNIVSVVAMMVTFITGVYVVLPHSKPLAIGVIIFSSFFLFYVSILLLIWMLQRPASKKLKV